MSASDPHKTEHITDELVGRSKPCPCGTMVDEMLINSMDDNFEIPPLSPNDIPPAGDKREKNPR